MSLLKVNLLGQFHVRTVDDISVDLEARKAQELLCYLLLHREQAHSRESLACVLWSDASAGQAKSYLRKALWQLQSALNHSCEAKDAWLQVDSESVEIQMQATLWLDVAVLENTFARVRGLDGRDLAPQLVELLRHAVDTYRGDLLEGWYQDWCLRHRERLQTIYLAMLDKLVSYYEHYQEFDTGISTAQRILACDPAHERTHQRLMSLYYLAGDRTAALRQYERCAAELARELGVCPDEYTKALYQKMRANRADEAYAVSPSQPVLSHSPLSLTDVLGRLKQFQSLLIEMQHQIEQDVQAIEQAMSGYR